MKKLKTGQPLQLSKECKAILIPSAEIISLPKGTVVNLHQVLGGNFTVVVNGNLARIDGDDADALGVSLPPCQIKKPSIGSAKPDGFVEIDEVWQELKTCYDPEIPVNIVELGLVYECKALNNPNGQGSDIIIQMTLTAPGCSMGPIIVQDIKQKLSHIKNVLNVDIELVFDPPWSMDKISESGKLSLGLL
jgi:probable FeS assembly SUF system protein SufT